MNGACHVAVLVGSLARQSCNRRLALALEEMAPASLRLEIVEISRLALYDPGRDSKPPPEWIVFRQQIRAADGILVMAPETHRTVPGVLRNALEIGSHPSGNSAWEGKPCGVVSVSPTSSIGFGGGYRLRQALGFLNVLVMHPPRVRPDNLGIIGSLFDDTGKLVNPLTRKSLREFLDTFDAWVHTTHKH